MTPSEYAAFVRETRDAHDDETAAAIIEAMCRGPYKPPPHTVLFPPRRPGGKGTVAVTESAQGATGTQDGVA